MSDVPKFANGGVVHPHHQGDNVLVRLDSRCTYPTPADADAGLLRRINEEKPVGRKFAGKVVVDRRAGIVTVDGEEVPWELSADVGVTARLGDPKRTTVSTVVLGILCDDVEVIPAERGEEEKP